MSILYVTSFNKALFEKSGKKMISTFLEHGSDGDLFITYEEGVHKMVDSRWPDNKKFIYYNLEKDSWMHDWLHNYKDYIPAMYGGVESPRINHHLPHLSQEKAKSVLFFRKQAARWFRKIVALRASLFHTKYKYIAFCDCDILFHKKLEFARVDNVCKDYDVIYHMGKDRQYAGTGIESGFIFWNMEKGGKKFLDYAFEIFQSGKFLDYLRWDDSYIFWNITQELSLKYLDLIPPDKHIPNGHVVEHGPFARYITHNKGSHKDIVGICK